MKLKTNTGLALCGPLFCFCLISCSSRSSVTHGTVTVDGKPMDAGTIHFESEDDETARGQGTVVVDGKFALPDSLAAGSYRVVVEGFRTTGRMISDPQRGPVPEMVQLQLQHLPIEVRLPPDGSGQVQIELKTTSE